MSWGVFEWRADGKYLNAKPLKIYKHEKAADKEASRRYKATGANVVARKMHDDDSLGRKLLGR